LRYLEKHKEHSLRHTLKPKFKKEQVVGVQLDPIKDTKLDKIMILMTHNPIRLGISNRTNTI